MEKERGFESRSYLSCSTEKLVGGAADGEELA